MRTLNFCSIEEFCEEFNDVIIDLDAYENYAEVVANYEDAKEIIKELVFYEYDLDSIDLEDPAWDGYDDAFSISVMDGKICCEKSKRGDKYPFSGATVAYFMEDVNQKNVTAYEDTAVKYCVCIEDKDDDLDDFEYEEDRCDCCPDRHECPEYQDEISLSSSKESEKKNDVKKKDNTDVKVDKDEDGIHGFTVSSADDGRYSSYSFYSSEGIDNGTLKMLMDIFDV